MTVAIQAVYTAACINIFMNRLNLCIMKEKVSANQHTASFPLKILIQKADGSFVQSETPVKNGIYLGFCIKNRAWLLRKMPTEACPPAVFIQALANMTGLPLCYPDEKDFNNLASASGDVKKTFDLLQKIQGTASLWRISSYNAAEKETMQDYLQNEQHGFIRLAINLDKMF